MASLRDLPGLERLLLRVDELAQRGREIGLLEDLAGLRGLARLARVREEHGLRVRPLLELSLLAFDRAGERGLHGIAVGHLDGRLQHVLEAHRPELGQHDEDAARRAGGHRRQRPGGRRVLELLRLEELGRRAGRRHTQRVDADHLLRLRVVDEGLRLAAPPERVPHGGGGGNHRAGRVDGIALLLEDGRAGRRRERFAGDRHPVAAVQDGLGRPLRHRARGEHAEDRDQGQQARRSHVPVEHAHRSPPQPAGSRGAVGDIIRQTAGIRDSSFDKARATRVVEGLGHGGSRAGSGSVPLTHAGKTQLQGSVGRTRGPGHPTWFSALAQRFAN